ncbi:hypothetical protein NQ314_004522 [Rhamnusium bicolor]|uniref:Uncharacterized protein n=1 Tax=Rhamnusium bicolor TaxID=1586634 RepID=A0AAV8ZJ71_9CUCU|nr:hypothetical protein NQ314_004522 [Rhamnusium bicolor]
MVVYFIHPLYTDEMVKFYASRNETVLVKALPLSSWFPFDEQKYYLESYLWHILDICVGAIFVTGTDIFTFSLIIFALGQIKILIYILSNFDEFVTKIQNQINCSQEEASFITLRECILKHKEIIR